MTTGARGLLFSQMTPRADEIERFERWYDGDHIPHRLALPHFTSARRYWQIDVVDGTPHHLAIYDLDSLAALQTPAYLDLKRSPGAETDYFLSSVKGFTRFTTELISDSGEAGAIGDYLSVVAFAVPDGEAAALEDWYLGEHVPALLQADDWLRVHRYRVVEGAGGPWTHLALHELRTAEVMDSPERARARTGPQRDALARRPWFAESGRWLYRRASSSNRPTDRGEA
jgi:hypothetical protein